MTRTSSCCWIVSCFSLFFPLAPSAEHTNGHNGGADFPTGKQTTSSKIEREVRSNWVCPKTRKLARTRARQRDLLFTVLSFSPYKRVLGLSVSPSWSPCLIEVSMGMLVCPCCVSVSLFSSGVVAAVVVTTLQ